MAKDNKNTNKTKLMNSIAVKVVWGIQIAVIAGLIVMIVAIMPVMQTYVPSDMFKAVNREITVVVIAGIIFGTVIGIIISSIVLRPIKMLNKGVNNLANLDFRASGNEEKLAKRKDETGEMARAIFAC